jgi:dienelactone hydrolase
MTATGGRDTRQAIEFEVRGTTVRGWLQTPDGTGPFPLVALAHGFGGLKEWTIPEVAANLNEEGIAALAFDYRNFGDSDGSPREEVDHPGQIEDFQSAVTFAATRPEVDPARVGLWGTSLGGRNALAAAALDSRVKCVVAQVPGLALSSQLWVDMMRLGKDVPALQAALDEDSRDRLLGREPRYISMSAPAESEPGSYLATHGEAEKRNWKARLTLQSYRPTIADNITHLMPLIAPRPLLMILAGREYPALLKAQRAAYAAASEPKSLLEVDGHHYSVYTTFKTPAITAAREWFAKHL